MTAPTIVHSTNHATATSVTTTAPSGSGGLLLFIASTDTGSTEPFHRINDFGGGATPTAISGHLISNYTAMPAAANVMTVWTKPDSGSEPASYVIDIYDAASGGSPLSRSTIFTVCRITHGSGTPVLGPYTTDVNDAGSANEPVAAAVTTDTADNLICYIVGWDEGKTITHPTGDPAGTTNLYDNDQSLHNQLLNYKTQASAGDTGTASWNISSGTRWTTTTIAFEPPSGGATAEVNATEANDTASVVATSAIAATVAATEAADTGSSAATLAVTAQVAASEAGDTASTAVAAAIVATASATEASDAGSVASAAAISAIVSASEGADTGAATAILGRTAAVSATEANDTGASTALLGRLASLTATEAPDTGQVIGSTAVLATLSGTEAGDTAASIIRVWIRQAPETAVWDDQAPEDAIWTRQAPETDPWTPQSPSAGNWTRQ